MIVRNVLIFITLTTTLISNAQEGMRLPETLPMNATDIKNYVRISDSIDKTNPDSAAQRYLKAWTMSKSIGFEGEILYCLAKVGSYYFEKKEYRKGRFILYQALPYCESPNEEDLWLVPSVYNLLGNINSRAGYNDSALIYYTNALQLMDSLSIDHPKLSIQINGNMGAVLATSRQYQQAIDYFRKSIHLLLERQHSNHFDLDDSLSLASSYQNMGSFYAITNQNNMDSAQYWWMKAINLYKALSKNEKLQDLYANIAISWLCDCKQNTDKAKFYLDSAIRIDPARAEKNIQIQLGLGRWLYFQGQFKNAIERCNYALILCENTGDRERKLLTYSTLAFSHAFLGNAKQSHNYQYLKTLLEDSLLNEEITRSISSMEVQYRLAEKDKILAENKAKLYQQRFWLAGSIGGGLILLLFVLGLVRSSRHKRRLYNEQVHNLKRQKKIDTLQARMEAEERERSRIAKELHDGLGVLLSAAKINHTILGKALPVSGKDNTAYTESDQILRQMQQEVKVITHNLIPHYISHRSLEDALETLAAKFNQPGAFQIYIQSYGAIQDLHPDRSFVLYRILEEIIHNAVKHSGGSEIIIQLVYHPEKLHITVEDNGQGFDMHTATSGMGLGNIKSRVHALNGYLNLSSEKEQGTIYTLEIPFEIKNDGKDTDSVN